MADLIKRSELIKTIDGLWDSKATALDRKDLYNVIKFSMDADVPEIKHGMWKTSETVPGTCCICSVCGSCPTMEYNYCPYCGAKMDA